HFSTNQRLLTSAPTFSKHTLNALSFSEVCCLMFGVFLLLCAFSSPAQSLTFSTLAGSPGSGSADGTGPAARFANPWGVASDTAGNLYVADTDNHTIRKITPAGVVSTLAGSPGASGTNDGTGSSARFFQPQGVGVDGAGYVY